jgi:hypothetical protein
MNGDAQDWFKQKVVSFSVCILYDEAVVYAC